jgi:alpha-tubulin suppressor-like RCC1 family protein
LALGAAFTCALFASGQTRCWGDNAKGQLGGGTTSVPSDVPVQVDLPGSVSELAAGGDHACARLANGDIYCWGDNSARQLGVIDKASVGPALSGASGMDATQLALGNRHSCIRTAGGEAWCWGSGTFHELGQSDPAASSPTPLMVDVGGLWVSEVAGGSNHTCARAADASAWCWGRNSSGQLGNGATGSGLPPGLVSGL